MIHGYGPFFAISCSVGAIVRTRSLCRLLRSHELILTTHILILIATASLNMHLYMSMLPHSSMPV